MLDGVTRLGDILAGSRRGVTGTQQWHGAQQREQGEGQHYRSLAHGDSLWFSTFAPITER
jgi:hypothetical protein